MITEKTVFILGAGASKPYGFPTAIELRGDIINKFIKSYIKADANYKGISESDVSVDPLANKIIEDFKLSSTKSFDLFLSRNKRYLDFGKLLLTLLIAEYEVNSKFREESIIPQYDWYFEIYDILTREISNHNNLISQFTQNKVSFITFNYDRSLEHFLYTSLLSSFTTERAKINELMSAIKIIHLYGKIAPLPWENSDYNWPYGKTDIYSQISDFYQNIHIIFEAQTEGREEAKDEIIAAKNIFFLGFGYADENLKALEFNSLLKREHRIYGTGMGLTDNEKDSIVSKLKDNNTNILIDNIRIDNCDSLMLLRKYY